MVQLNESGIPITIGNRIPSTTEKVGEGGHPDLEMKGGGGGGSLQKLFFGPSGLSPFPRSATVNNNSSTDEELPLTWTFRLATFYDLRLDAIRIDFTTTRLTIS